MLAVVALFVGSVAILLFLGWASAESRPGFLNPNKKYTPFAAPIRVDEDRESH